MLHVLFRLCISEPDFRRIDPASLAPNDPIEVQMMVASVCHAKADDPPRSASTRCRTVPLSMLSSSAVLSSCLFDRGQAVGQERRSASVVASICRPRTPAQAGCTSRKGQMYSSSHLLSAKDETLLCWRYAFFLLYALFDASDLCVGPVSI